MTTDHPPVIPPMTVTTYTFREPRKGEYGAWYRLSDRAPIVREEHTVPLGLSPEQPVRCGGGE